MKFNARRHAKDQRTSAAREARAEGMLAGTCPTTGEQLWRCTACGHVGRKIPGWRAQYDRPGGDVTALFCPECAPQPLRKPITCIRCQAEVAAEGDLCTGCAFIEGKGDDW